MKHRFVRLMGSGVIVATTALGSSALADSGSISLTGPGSHNSIMSHQQHWLSSQTQNWLGLTNLNGQWAGSGSVQASHNTQVGGGGGSGAANNLNDSSTGVGITNTPMSFNLGGLTSGNHDASIDLTGPGSTNQISFNNSSSFMSTTTNVVGVTNASNQQAQSGDVTISGNTVVGGVGGSGNASNSNTADTGVMVNNGSAQPLGLVGGSNDSVSIGTTGPGSTNTVHLNNSSSVQEATTNVVGVTNTNQQSAQTGDVTVSHNTVAGGSGSGMASNTNSTQTQVSLSN